MNIKRSLVILVVVVSVSIALPALAFAATDPPESIPVTQQLDFAPLIYTSIVLTAILICLLFVIAFQVRRIREKGALVSEELFGITNKFSELGYPERLDYRLIETPEELSGKYTQQSDLAREEAIKRLAENQQPSYRPKHHRQTDERIAQALPAARIRLLPEMQHSQRRVARAAALETPVELETLIRKIS